jgi:hypothetical protein
VWSDGVPRGPVGRSGSDGLGRKGITP